MDILNDIANIMCNYLLDILEEGDPENVIKYIEEKNLNKELIETYKIGYVDYNLVKIITKKYTYNQLYKLGLIAKKENEGKTKLTWFLFERVMFPIFSSKGNVIAFSGRSITENPIKYMNTKETDLYHKNKAFFGLNTSFENIIKSNQVIIVEGNTDQISMYANNIKNSLATCGTALTKEHIKNLKKINPEIEIILFYDFDKAGIKAAKQCLFKFSEIDYIIFSNKEKHTNKDPDILLKENFNPGKYILNRADFLDKEKENWSFEDFDKDIDYFDFYNAPENGIALYDSIKLYMKTYKSITQKEALKFSAILESICNNKLKDNYNPVFFIKDNGLNFADIVKKINLFSQKIEFYKRKNEKFTPFTLNKRFTKKCIYDIKKHFFFIKLFGTLNKKHYNKYFNYAKYHYDI